MHDLKQRVGYLIGVVAHLMHNDYNQKLKEFNLTIAQSKVLYLLAEQGEQVQATLQQSLYIQASTMNGIIDSMQRKKIIQKKPSEMDRRTNVIAITEKGRAVYDQLWENIDQFDAELMDGFSQEEEKLLLSWLKRMEHNLTDSTGK